MMYRSRGKKVVIRFMIPEYVFRRSSTNKINPASDSEYSDKAVWILCGWDNTDLNKKRTNKTPVGSVLSFTCRARNENSLTKV